MERICATYLIETPLVVEKAAANLAGEQSSGTFLAVPGETDKPKQCFAARVPRIAAVKMVAPLTPDAPLCRAHAPGSPADSLEVVFKGGQVRGEDYLSVVKCRDFSTMP